MWERLGAASPGPISPYLANFVTKKVPARKQAALQQKSAVQRNSKSKKVAESGQTLAQTLTEVHSAVEAVIGVKAGDDQPLMEAGLDSLGKHD